MSVRSWVWSPHVRSCRDPVTWLLLRHSNPIIHITEYHISQSALPRSPEPLLPNGNIFTYCPKLALAAATLLLLPFFCIHLFLVHQILVVDCYQSGPSSRSLPLKQIQCSTLLNVRRFAPIPAPSLHRKQLLPWLTLCQQAEHQEGWEGSIPPSSLEILHRCGCSTGMGAPQLGDPAPPRAWWGSPYRTSHPWKAMYKANSRIMPTITGRISIIPQKHSTSNLFFFNLCGAWWRWMQGPQTHRNIYSGSANSCPCVHVTVHAPGQVYWPRTPILSTWAVSSKQTILCLIFIIWGKELK